MTTEDERHAAQLLALAHGFTLGGSELSRQLVEVLLLDIEARLVGGRAFSTVPESTRAQQAALFRAE